MPKVFALDGQAWQNPLYVKIILCWYFPEIPMKWYVNETKS